MCIHYFVVKYFKNRSYYAYYLYDGPELVSSCLVIPAYYKWPFMSKKDVQITYVMTNEKYRGQGMAKKMIKRIFYDLGSTVGSFWYVTDTENYASQRVAEKLGFSLVGIGKKTKITNRLRVESPSN